jgi:Ser/Thr protein kinase RdoA (MazF antagonist)
MPGFGISVEPARYARGVSSDAALGAAVAAVYPIAPIRGCAWIERVASQLARIETVGRVCWLKLDGYGRGIVELEAAAEVAAALAGRGLSVAAPVARRDGRYAGAIALPGGPRLALLFDEAPGDEVAVPSVAQAEALGALLARVHAATDVPAAARRRRIDTDSLAREPLRAVGRWLARAGGDADAVREAARRCAALADLVDELATIIAPAAPTAPTPPGAGALPVGLCHGDVQPENVRFDGDRPTLFDLEACGVGPCAYDLACYWRQRIGLAPDGADPPHAEWLALVRGYERVRSLSRAERRAIPALAALRAVWVMALPAAPGATWGQDWLLDPEYLDAHLAMIERLATAARAASPAAITQP